MFSRLDVDFVDFLECSSDLPRATSTSAISSASVFKMITRVGETVNKMAYKMEEGDPWFEEKTLQVEQMESQLKKLYSIVESVVTCRRELALATGQFSQATALLASTEESHHLSRSLEGLARVEERVEGTLQEQADTDFAHILELVRDYLSLVAAVKVSREKGKLWADFKWISGGARGASEGFSHMANCSHNPPQVILLLDAKTGWNNFCDKLKCQYSQCRLTQEAGATISYGARWSA